MCGITENQRIAIAHLETIREAALEHFSQPTPGEVSNKITQEITGIDAAAKYPLIAALIAAERALADAQAEQVKVTHEVLITVMHNGNYSQFNDDTGRLDTHLEDSIAAVAAADVAYKAALEAFEADRASKAAAAEAQTATLQ